MLGNSGSVILRRLRSSATGVCAPAGAEALAVELRLGQADVVHVRLDVALAQPLDHPVAQRAGMG